MPAPVDAEERLAARRQDLNRAAELGANAGIAFNAEPAGDRRRNRIAEVIDELEPTEHRQIAGVGIGAAVVGADAG
jgi:hypothetical protein